MYARAKVNGTHFEVPRTTPSIRLAKVATRLCELWLGRQFVSLIPHKLAVLSVEHALGVLPGFPPLLALPFAACVRVRHSQMPKTENLNPKNGYVS
jgi:hypothetical protein